VILNETLEKALAACGGALPHGIDLVLSGHIDLWEAIGFADKRPAEFVLGSGGTDLGYAIKGPLTGAQWAGRMQLSGDPNMSEVLPASPRPTRTVGM
jgi:hypothetical protein